MKKKRRSKSREAEKKYSFETYYNEVGSRAFRPPFMEDKKSSHADLECLLPGIQASG